jgi:hypothetical protein
MKTADLYASGILFALGLLTLLVVIPAQVADVAAIGLPPRGMPTFTIGAVTVLSGLLFLKTLFSRADYGTMPFHRDELVAMLVGLAVTVAATLLFGRVGFLAAGLFVIVALMLFMGERNWRILAIVPLGTVAATYVFVTRLLHVTVP